MAKLVTFKINNKGVEQAATGPGSKAAVRDMAGKLKVYAISISPHASGAYASSFGIRQHIRRDWPLGRPNPRACADLYNSDPAAIVIEKGSAHQTSTGGIVTTPAFRVLQQTLAHHGPYSNRVGP